MGETSSESEEMKQRLLKQEDQLQQLDSIYEENKLLQQKCIELDDARISKLLSYHIHTNKHTGLDKQKFSA